MLSKASLNAKLRLIAFSYGFVCLQGKCLNLNEQVDLFQRTVRSELPRHFKSPDELSNYLAKSIFLVSVGSNDYINNYLEPNVYDTSKRYPPEPFAELLMDSLSQRFKVMFNLLN
jgi:hypothetical protein